MFLEFYDGQSVFATGTTGFVGKCMLEKLLRDTKVSRVFILIRPKKGKPPQTRFLTEVANSPIFDRLRNIHGASYEAFLNSKVVAVGGDITKDGLALSPADAEAVHSQVQVILNCAANVDFNERLDGALTTNCRGPLRLLGLAKSCTKLRAYVHVSTAYVNCNQPNGTRVMEVLPEVNVEPEVVLKQIFDPAMTPEQILKDTPKLIGRYPNTYTFTKALGEIMLSRASVGYPTAIVRPTIIGCSLRDPVPGWVDTVSAGGAMYLSGGLGFMPVQPGNENMVGDQIPVDLVVNTVLAAAADIAFKCEAAGRADPLTIYHSSSSTTNPVQWSKTARAVVRYWRHCPSAQSQIYCRYRMVSNPLLYRMSHLAQVSIPALLLGTYARVSGDPKVQKKAETFKKVLKRTRILADTFMHFVNNEWFFDNSNTMRISGMMSENDRKVLTIDPGVIGWGQWFDDFQYGLQRWVLKDEVVRRNHSENLLKGVNGKGDHGLFGGWFMSDFFFALRYKVSSPGLYKVPSSEVLRKAVLESDDVVRAIVDSGEECKARVAAMVDKLGAKMSMPSVRFMGWLMRKLFRKLFDSVTFNPDEVAALHDIPEGAAVIMAPTHKSYLDFVLISWALFAQGLKVPHIAAGEDFLNLTIVTWLFRHSGAFFIPRSTEDPLWGAVVTAYMKELLRHNQWIEFFAEGSRSRTGRVMPARIGLLKVCVEALAAGNVKEIFVVPAALSYERCLEVSSHINELTGVRKTKESLPALIRASPSALSNNLGATHLSFGNPIRLSDMLLKDKANDSGDARIMRVTRQLAYDIGQGMVNGLRVTTTGILAGVLLRKGGKFVKRDELQKEVAALRKEMGDRDVTFILPSTLSRDMDRAFMKISHLIEVQKTEGASRGDEGVRARADDTRAILELSFLHNQVIHVFARESAVYAAMHAGSNGRAGVTSELPGSERGWVTKKDAREWFELIRDAMLSDSLHAFEQEVDDDFQAAVHDSLSRGLVDVTDDGNMRIRESATSLPIISHCYYQVVLPLIDAYWGVAELMLSLSHSLPLKALDLSKSLHENLLRMHQGGILQGADSISLASIRGALTFMQNQGVIERRDGAGKPTLSRKGVVTLPDSGRAGLSNLASRLRACRPLSVKPFLSSAKL